MLYLKKMIRARTKQSVKSHPKHLYDFYYENLNFLTNLKKCCAATARTASPTSCGPAWARWWWAAATPSSAPARSPTRMSSDSPRSLPVSRQSVVDEATSRGDFPSCGLFPQFRGKSREKEKRESVAGSLFQCHHHHFVTSHHSYCSV